jgi:hypothetical protein
MRAPECYRTPFLDWKAWIPCTALAALLAGCAPAPRTSWVDPHQPARPVSGEESPEGIPVYFLLVYLVHGDGNYTYFDELGQRRVADAEAVARAMQVARVVPNSEVFIFHQKPRRFRWFRRSTDGTLYHFRNGIPVFKSEYSRGGSKTDFEVESTLFQRHVYSPCASLFFVFFGHRIPPEGGRGYSRSYPMRHFSQRDFVRGLKRFILPGCSRPSQQPAPLVVQAESATRSQELTDFMPWALRARTSETLASP